MSVTNRTTEAKRTERAGWCVDFGHAYPANIQPSEALV